MARPSPSITHDRSPAVALWSHTLLGSSGPTPPYRPLFSDLLCLLSKDWRGSPLPRLSPLCSFCHSHSPMRQLPCEAVGHPPTPTLPIEYAYVSPQSYSAWYLLHRCLSVFCLAVLLVFLDRYIVAVGGFLSLQSIAASHDTHVTWTTLPASAFAADFF